MRGLSRPLQVLQGNSPWLLSVEYSSLTTATAGRTCGLRMSNDRSLGSNSVKSALACKSSIQARLFWARVARGTSTRQARAFRQQQTGTDMSL